MSRLQESEWSQRTGSAAVAGLLALVQVRHHMSLSVSSQTVQIVYKGMCINHLLHQTIKVTKTYVLLFSNSKMNLANLGNLNISISA